MNMLVRLEDEWDPNLLFNQPHECRIYGDDMAQTWAVVSSEHYQACIKYRWGRKPSRTGNKKYLFRNRQVGHGRDGRKQENYFLHEFILVELMGQPKPSPRHIIDHRNGKDWDCQKENLRWVAPSFNRININGSHNGEEHDEHARGIV